MTGHHRDILKALRHPYIIKYRDHFADQDTNHFYIFTDFYGGGDLRTLIKARKSRTEEETILKYFCQLSMAVAYCHSEKIRFVHRDIKRENSTSRMPFAPYQHLSSLYCRKWRTYTPRYSLLHWRHLLFSPAHGILLRQEGSKALRIERKLSRASSHWRLDIILQFELDLKPRYI
jgi:serine/threonine protein kinase